MMILIILIVLLVLSVGINIFLVTYLRWILKKLAFLSENIADLLSSIEGFSKHLEGIHELETYYGDPTLKNLITHSKQLLEELGMYEEIYTLFSDENDEELEKIFNREDIYATEDDEEE